MCTVWIVSPLGIRAVDSAALEPRARIEQAWNWAAEITRSKPAVKTPKPVAKLRLASAPAPLQCGGSLVKSTSYAYTSKEDYSDHYRMRCNQSNDRNKTCSLRKRRLQVERW